MTSSANDEWDYEKLRKGIDILECEVNRCNRVLDIAETWLVKSERDAVQQCIDFIEYNMREMEIKPSTNNGD